MQRKYRIYRYHKAPYAKYKCNAKPAQDSLIVALVLGMAQANGYSNQIGVLTRYRYPLQCI